MSPLCFYFVYILYVYCSEYSGIIRMIYISYKGENMKVDMKVELENILSKTVKKFNKGKSGIIYVPRQYIGKTVYVIPKGDEE